MEKITLSELFNSKLFVVPDYQRGYAWEGKQWREFAEDLDALVLEGIKGHYTGTIVTYEPESAPSVKYHLKPVKKVDVVDGQQRLTTTCLYLSVILHKLMQKNPAYSQYLTEFLYDGMQPKVNLGNDTSDLYLQLLQGLSVSPKSPTRHGIRLFDAHQFFQQHLAKMEKTEGSEHLAALFEAMTSRLFFTYYTIKEESEIGMTFELMNSRGKELSPLELLKNYLMYWVSRNENDATERSHLVKRINTTWKDVYTHVSAANGSEEQCLRIAWLLGCNHSAKSWKGYGGFKDDAYIPLRDFSAKSKADTKQFIQSFMQILSNVALHYAAILAPHPDRVTDTKELILLTAIRNTARTANLLPLLIAARHHYKQGAMSAEQYQLILQSVECFIYRIYLYYSKRSNTGQPDLYRLAADMFKGKVCADDLVGCLCCLTIEYVSDSEFEEEVRRNDGDDWYSYPSLLKYTLFEYELYLLKNEGKGKTPHLRWQDLSNSTIEHILPQNPAQKSRWFKVWTKRQHKDYVHDLGNLVLTENNNNYQNFEFSEKKGKVGKSPSYANADIRQEREIAAYADWDLEALLARRKKLEDFILERWALPLSYDDTDSLSDS